MFATYVRNSEIGDKVIYFGPMGCRTGFYLLVRDVEPTEVARIVRWTLIKIAEHDGEMFGNTRKECGNYKELSVEAAKVEARRYLEFVPEGKSDFSYPNS
jgi:S-ribosylhomocysteine lyase